jgi:hypothetical protein
MFSSRPAFLGQVPIAGLGQEFPVKVTDWYAYKQAQKAAGANICDIWDEHDKAPESEQGNWKASFAAAVKAYADKYVAGDLEGTYLGLWMDCPPKVRTQFWNMLPRSWKPEDVPTVDPRGEAERMRRDQKVPKTKYPDTPSVPQGVLPWLPVTPKPWIPTTPMPSVPRSEPTTARESYEQKLKEFDARPRTPTPYEMTSEETRAEALRRHQEWMRSAGIQERPPVSTAKCQPNQFFDGEKCRSSISAMPGGIPTGGSGGPIGPTSSLAPMVAPSAVMTGRVRFPVVNLRRV